jgi:ribonuclease HI
MHGAFFFRLEDVGPAGNREKPTSNRTELRAAALRYFGTETTETGLQFWNPRKHASLVIATDSTYVVNGATKWCKVCERNGWRKSNGAPVKNQDLWELLLKRLREFQSTRCKSISFGISQEKRMRKRIERRTTLSLWLHARSLVFLLLVISQFRQIQVKFESNVKSVQL